MENTTQRQSVRHPDIEWVDINFLKEHEAVKEKKATAYLRFASRRKTIRAKPILIDRETGVILDGHHRYFVAKRIGLLIVPCICVDYLEDDNIIVLPRKREIPVSKKAVIDMGLSGETFSPKTTKHVYVIPAMHRIVTYNPKYKN